MPGTPRKKYHYDFYQSNRRNPPLPLLQFLFVPRPRCMTNLRVNVLKTSLKGNGTRKQRGHKKRRGADLFLHCAAALHHQQYRSLSFSHIAKGDDHNRPVGDSVIDRDPRKKITLPRLRYLLIPAGPHYTTTSIEHAQLFFQSERSDPQCRQLVRQRGVLLRGVRSPFLPPFLAGG